MKKRLHFFIAGGLLIIGIILGSIFDLRINEALFDRYNGFGLAVSSFGMLPGYGCLAFFGGALTAIVARDKNMKTWLKVILYIFSVAAVCHVFAQRMHIGDAVRLQDGQHFFGANRQSAFHRAIADDIVDIAGGDVAPDVLVVDVGPNLHFV